MLSNLVKQLAGCREDLPNSIRELYERHKNRRPILNEISATLRSTALSFPRSFIIIDALDECQNTDGSRQKLMAELFNLQKSSGVNLFVTSRFIPDIIKRFEACLTLSIRPSHEDVFKYLDSHTYQLSDYVTDDLEF